MVNSAGSTGAPGPGGTAWEGRATPLRIGGPLAPLSVRHLAFEPQVTATQNAPARCTEVGSPRPSPSPSPPLPRPAPPPPLPPSRDRPRPSGEYPPPGRSLHTPRRSLPPPPRPRQAPPLPRAALCAPRRLPSVPPVPGPLAHGHGARGGARAAAPGHLHRRHHRHEERARR